MCNVLWPIKELCDQISGMFTEFLHFLKLYLYYFYWGIPEEEEEGRKEEEKERKKGEKKKFLREGMRTVLYVYA